MVKPADMENSANIMRVALILSILGHVLFVTFSARDLRPTAHGDAMTLELIPANEAPAGPDLGAEASAEQAKEAKAEPTAEKPSTVPAPTTKTESGPRETKAPDTKPPKRRLRRRSRRPPLRPPSRLSRSRNSHSGRRLIRLHRRRNSLRSRRRPIRSRPGRAKCPRI
jgi:hypothetical protein